MQSSTSSPSKIAVAVVLAAGLCTPLLSAPPASATQDPIAVDTATVAMELEFQAADIAGGLELIERVPGRVLLEGQAAYDAWIAANQHVLAAARASVLECSGAIALLIASTAFPVAKILKIKRLINSLGGVTKAVRVMWGASFSWEKIRALGGAAAALGAELLGVAAVKRGCFR
ncbi:hypothetical protein BIV03_14555 [Curtobacterium sp. MCBA15_016]|uniref:hypothetical protein n=1 Tax=Curtobacterium sp. MCBA15_016 TaxID=1898740 RepID=UPI0008DE3886|nr:hypothetical protein [Curtobacterium sp. MCBA15_016]OII21724.1 hypothetical protein BIV03_14555 [Curtobacterium sp. MCBA15_016]